MPSKIIPANPELLFHWGVVYIEEDEPEEDKPLGETEFMVHLTGDVEEEKTVRKPEVKKEKTVRKPEVKKEKLEEIDRTGPEEDEPEEDEPLGETEFMVHLTGDVEEEKTVRKPEVKKEKTVRKPEVKKEKLKETAFMVHLTGDVEEEKTVRKPEVKKEKLEEIDRKIKIDNSTDKGLDLAPFTPRQDRPDVGFSQYHHPVIVKEETKCIIKKATCKETREDFLGKFHLLSNNCEHFANLCRYGVKRSDQARGVRDHPARAAGFVKGELEQTIKQIS